MTKVSPADLRALIIEALTGAGFSSTNAISLADQTILAEELGQRSVGLAHLFDFIDGLRAGGIDGAASPGISKPLPAVILVDGNGGLPQAGFDMVFDDLVDTTRQLGLCLFLQRNATLCGSLGTFPLRLAEVGLLALAATNGSPLLAGSGSTAPVFCTNPMAFAAPQANGAPLLLDQSSSATAYVNIRTAAERGETIPVDWAMDKDGNPTIDPDAALEGTLLPFGGSRGANIALMVEILAAALPGANWSLDAPSFFDGEDCPATGLFVLAICPDAAAPNFDRRMAAQMRRLANDFGVHLPGLRKAENRKRAQVEGFDVDQQLLDRLKELLE